MHPASTIQQQFLFIENLYRGNTAYTIPALHRIKGKLDIGALKQSLQMVAARHEILRTTFREDGGQFVQVVHEELSLDFKEEQISAPIAGIPEVIEQEIQRPFNVNGTEPLWRTRIFRISEEESFLLFTMQHSIIDLHALRIFTHETERFYAAFSSGETAPELPPACPYSEYSQWEEQFIGSERFNKMVGFWKQQLTGINQTLDLPTDFKRPAFLQLAGAAESFKLDSAICSEIQQFCSEHLIKPYLLLQAAYLILLHRYTGKSDFITGVPFTNRRNDNHETAMGCFVNMLPIPARFEKETTVENFLKQMRKTMLLAHRNQEVTIKSIINELKPARDLSYNPLFQTGFTFEPPTPLNLHGLNCKAIKRHNHGAQLDLMAVLWESGDEFEGHIEYNTSLFRSETVQRFAENYKTLIRSILTNAQQPLSALEIVSTGEQETILKNFNTPAVNVSTFPTVTAMFEKQAFKHPERIAAMNEHDKNISYADLNARANQLARHLIQLEPTEGKLIGIFMTRTVDMLTALLAVLKAGAAYVPIEPSFPEERIRYMLGHSQVATVLTDSRTTDLLDSNIPHKICVDKIEDQLKQESCENPDIQITPESPAYVIYTSGSTGNPKGVEIPHGALSNFLQSMATEPGLNADDSLLAVTTLSFDISMLELFLPLTAGAKVIIASRETALDGTRMLQSIRKHDISILQATPMTWRMLIAAGWTRQDALKVLCGGEPLPPDLAAELLERSDQVWNMYGPTETTIWSTCHHITTAEPPISVGKPIANTSVYVLNEQLNPVPIGVSSALYIGGAGLANGYLHNQELTETVFIKPPTGITESNLIYNTGDIARFDESGNLEILGRSDHQVKISGFRIELGEIEAQLASHPAIKECVVSAKDHPQGNKSLVAFYTQHAPIAFSELRTHLSQTLPEYMVPDFHVVLDTLPHTPNGKIDRKALPSPNFSHRTMKSSYTAPASDLESELADLWKTVLQIDQVGVDDRFFELGGNSLLAMQFLTELKNRMNHELSVIDIFQHSSIRELTSLLRKEESTESTNEDSMNRAQLRQKALEDIRRRRSR